MRIHTLLIPTLGLVLGAVNQQYASAFGGPLPTRTKATAMASPLFVSSSSVTSSASLPELFPVLANSLISLGFSSPTPIQAAAATLLSATSATENLMLIAPTGSGKTLAYLLPALTKAIQEEGTILMVAPTRELAVQLLRDAMSLLTTLTDEEDIDESMIALSIRGIEWPTTVQLEEALLLIGTPDELLSAITNVKGGYEFCSSLSAIVLDEVDVLLPLPPKILRTALDIGGGDKKGNRKKKVGNNTPQDERRRQEQKRKLLAAKRKGTEISNSQLVSPTEKLLNVVATSSMAEENTLQVLAGSATASRKTLDRLNRALRVAATTEASSTLEQVFGGDMKVCRPVVDNDEIGVEGAAQRRKESGSTDDESWVPPVLPQHTIRAVSVPEQVKHSYVALSKEQASSKEAVLATVAKVTQQLKPETALLFICGEFGKSNKAAATVLRAPPKGATNRSRRNAANKQKKQAAVADSKAPKAGMEVLSARQACSTLSSYGIGAKPLHVALGLEGAASMADDDEDEDTPDFLVTFEGSARGLHFEGVDVVFVVGRPASAASYLHLAGRVGRSSPSKNGDVVVRPGTVVSICTKGSATELEKWTKQVGASESLQEIVL